MRPSTPPVWPTSTNPGCGTRARTRSHPAGPKLCGSRALKARLWARVQREQAMREFEHQRHLDPPNPNAACEAAEMRWKSQAYDRARQFVEAAFRYYPDLQEALLGFAKVLISLSKPDATLPHPLKPVSLNPRSKVAHYTLSQLYRALGNVNGQRTPLDRFQRMRSQTFPELDTLRKNLLCTEATQQELESQDAT